LYLICHYRPNWHHWSGYCRKSLLCHERFHEASLLAYILRQALLEALRRLPDEEQLQEKGIAVREKGERGRKAAVMMGRDGWRMGQGWGEKCGTGEGGEPERVERWMKWGDGG
jgi:hypothetical protein